jgi:hypothetical protein
MRQTIMSFDKEDVKQGIDNVAGHLKDAVDSIADKTSESRGKIKEKAREVARKTGEEMIEQGRKLKNAASGDSSATLTEKPSC